MPGVERLELAGRRRLRRTPVDADGRCTGDGAARLNRSPNPLSMFRGSKRGAKTAAPPINTPGMSAASTIAAPAATAPRSATFPTTPDPKTEPGFQTPACMKGVVKDVSPSSNSPSGDSSGARVLRSCDGGMTPRTCGTAWPHITHFELHSSCQSPTAGVE